MQNISIKDTLSRDLKDLPGEIWKDIPGYEDRYQISQYSRVKSIIFQNPVIIKKTLSSGKFKVILSDRLKRRKNHEVGRLCATVFNREPEDNEVIRYKDRNCLFDTLFNIEWISRKESIQNAYKDGKFPNGHGKGDRNGMSKLSSLQVNKIRESFEVGVTKKQLSESYSISVRIVENIVKGRTWKSLSN